MEWSVFQFLFLILQTIHSLIIDNGMHYQSEYDEAPFHQKQKYSQHNYNALQSYLSQDIDLMDLPMQIVNNPFSKQRQHLQNKPFYSKNNQSISKCAVTQISSKNDQYEESITPICQKLFQHQTYSQIEKQFQMMQTLPTEVITQATFKPNDLKEYLRENKLRDTSKLKQILKENVFNQTKKEDREVKSRAISSHISKKQQQHKQKTKYQRILQEYFNSKSKKETIKSRLSRQKLPNYKLQYINQHAQSNLQQSNRQSKNSKVNPMIRSRSQKQIQVKQKVNHDMLENVILTKTFSQNIFQNKSTNRTRGQSKQFQSSWMKMSFQQRQSRTLDNRRSKQNVGQKHNLQKQIRQCTFKPQINDFKPSVQKHIKGGSYAKLYYQKIRRRI